VRCSWLIFATLIQKFYVTVIRREEDKDILSGRGVLFFLDAIQYNSDCHILFFSICNQEIGEQKKASTVVK